VSLDKPEKSAKVIYSEVVRPPVWLIAFTFFLLGSLALSIWAAFDNPAGQISLVLALIALYVISTKVAMKIEVTETELRIGPAHIERIYLGEIKELSIDQMRLTRGRDADPAAFLAIRFWQPRGIKIEICDPRDPAPYWLVSSKHAASLARALEK
jgi:hypothetical protein